MTSETFAMAPPRNLRPTCPQPASPPGEPGDQSDTVAALSRMTETLVRALISASRFGFGKRHHMPYLSM